MIDITAEVQRSLEPEKSGALLSRAECSALLSRAECSALLSRAECSALLVFVPHTTAAVTINENADPSVRADILAELNKVKQGHPLRGRLHPRRGQLGGARQS
jgi:thiamine phosphate synthase YjbQ (UPF0047 family)